MLNSRRLITGVLVSVLAMAAAWCPAAESPGRAADGARQRMSLQAAFRRPPDAVKPWAYWWWLKGNVDEASITRDLEAMKRKGFDEYDEFRRAALEATGVSFCTRLHFGRPVPGESERYIRFAYGGIGNDAIVEGLEKLKKYIES